MYAAIWRHKSATANASGRPASGSLPRRLFGDIQARPISFRASVQLFARGDASTPSRHRGYADGRSVRSAHWPTWLARQSPSDAVKVGLRRGMPTRGAQVRHCCSLAPAAGAASPLRKEIDVPLREARSKLVSVPADERAGRSRLVQAYRVGTAAADGRSRVGATTRCRSTRTKNKRNGS